MSGIIDVGLNRPMFSASANTWPTLAAPLGTDIAKSRLYEWYNLYLNFGILLSIIVNVFYNDGLVECISAGIISHSGLMGLIKERLII